MSSFDGKQKYAEYKLVDLHFNLHANRIITKYYLVISKTLDNYALKQINRRVLISCYLFTW